MVLLSILSRYLRLIINKLSKIRMLSLNKRIKLNSGIRISSDSMQYNFGKSEKHPVERV